MVTMLKALEQVLGPELAQEQEADHTEECHGQNILDLEDDTDLHKMSTQASFTQHPDALVDCQTTADKL